MTVMSEIVTVRFGLTKCVAHSGRVAGDAMIILINWVNEARFRSEGFKNYPTLKGSRYFNLFLLFVAN